jgi:hypothetical protein
MSERITGELVVDVTMFFDVVVNDLCVVRAGANASVEASMAAAKTQDEKRTILLLVFLFSITLMD